MIRRKSIFNTHEGDETEKLIGTSVTLIDCNGRPRLIQWKPTIHQPRRAPRHAPGQPQPWRAYEPPEDMTPCVRIAIFLLQLRAKIKNVSVIMYRVES